MPLWGQHKWGEAQWGWHDLPAAQEEQRLVYGGNAAWLPDEDIQWRQGCPKIYRVHPTTFVNVEELPLFAGGSRTASASDMIQTESLSMNFNDPTGTYQIGGVNASKIAPGTPVMVQWTVSTAHGSLTYRNGPFVIRNRQRRGYNDTGGDAPPVTAEWWTDAGFRAPLREFYTFTDLVRNTQLLFGYNHAEPVAIVDCIKYAINQITGSGAATPSGGTYWRADGYIPSPNSRTFADLEGTASTIWNTTGSDFTWGELIRWLARYVPVVIVHDPDGFLRLRWARTHINSGWTISCDPNRGGVLAVPYGSIVPTVSPARLRRVRYFQWQIVPDMAGGIFGEKRLLADAISHSDVNPWDHMPAHQKDIVEDSIGAVPMQAFTAGSASNLAYHMLEEELMQADQVNVTLDSAAPNPQMRSSMRIYLPDKDIQGLYAMLSVNQPLGLGMQTWTLGWLGRV